EESLHEDEALLAIDKASPLGQQAKIEMNGVKFTYSDAATPNLDGIDIRIYRGTSSAIVGSTGSGKMTELDHLHGLLDTSDGSVSIDNDLLTGDRVRGWQAAVGYVPQHVFLSDDTIARNIAFGIPDDEIDLERVERAARIAQVDEFVASLPNGFNTHVGERGIRLSGGQRQRLGMARALYCEPEVLILDEATSALDSITERTIFDSLMTATRNKTLIVVTQRLTTVQGFQNIVLLEAGRVVDQGTFEELVTSS